MPSASALPVMIHIYDTDIISHIATTLPVDVQKLLTNTLIQIEAD